VHLQLNRELPAQVEPLRQRRPEPLCRDPCDEGLDGQYVKQRAAQVTAVQPNGPGVVLRDHHAARKPARSQHRVQQALAQIALRHATQTNQHSACRPLALAHAKRNLNGLLLPVHLDRQPADPQQFRCSLQALGGVVRAHAHRQVPARAAVALQAVLQAHVLGEQVVHGLLVERHKARVVPAVLADDALGHVRQLGREYNVAQPGLLQAQPVGLQPALSLPVKSLAEGFRGKLRGSSCKHR
jgi:hypothetical protein